MLIEQQVLESIKAAFVECSIDTTKIQFILYLKWL